MGYDNYRRSSLRALHIRSKLRRLISDSTSDLDAISDNTEPTPPLTPVNGQIPRKDCFISYCVLTMKYTQGSSRDSLNSKSQLGSQPQETAIWPCIFFRSKNKPKILWSNRSLMAGTLTMIWNFGVSFGQSKNLEMYESEWSFFRGAL